jgi:hypothetical protein
VIAVEMADSEMLALREASTMLPLSPAAMK